MSSSKPNLMAGTDWTGLLADPDLARNLGTLLQTYRDAPPERREQALLAAMREIKRKTSGTGGTKIESGPQPQPIPTPASSSPPFEPDIFSPTWGQDRRRHPRIT